MKKNGGTPKYVEAWFRRTLQMAEHAASSCLSHGTCIPQKFKHTSIQDIRSTVIYCRKILQNPCAASISKYIRYVKVRIPHRITAWANTSHNQLRKKNMRRSGRPDRPMGVVRRISAELSVLIPTAIGQTPGYCAQKLWTYIRKSELQNMENRRYIICDEKLKRVCKKDMVSIFDLTKIMKKHMEIR